MTHDERCSLAAPVRAAIAELEAIILAQHPEATFYVERSDEDPEAIHLVTTVDLEDFWELFDLVTDRQVELLVDDGIPIYVIPLRTPERNRAVEEAMRTRPVGAHVPLDDEHP